MTRAGIFVIVPSNCRAHSLYLHSYKHNVHRRTIRVLTFHTASFYQLILKKEVLSKVGIKPESTKSKPVLLLEMVTCKATPRVLDSLPLRTRPAAWLDLITNRQHRQRRLRLIIAQQVGVFGFF